MPAAGNDFVCHYCLGPVTNYPQCWGCHELFQRVHKSGDDFLMVPGELTDTFVPMSTALKPSPWYTYLLQYKNGLLDAYGPILAAVAYTFLSEHEDDIAALLGGPPTCVTVVPSTRGFSHAEQPLVKALSLIAPLKEQLEYTLDHVPGSSVDRWHYNPAAFAAGPTSVEDERILLVEDAWITGATPISAAGALLRDGAASVAIVALARVVNEGFLSDPKHPYRQGMEVLYDPAAWPR